MKKIHLLFIHSFLLYFCLDSLAQGVYFSDDAKERGYFNRPYIRYEAEPGKCRTDGEFLEASAHQQNVQSEASNQTALELYYQNSYVEWENDEAADGLTIRFSLPDGEDGLGSQGTLALYVNNEFVLDITLDSYWAWQWFRKNDSNKYPDNTPATTSFPRMRFDEIHIKLDRKIPAGATFRLAKADNDDSPYAIDFVELEAVPEPVSFESIPDANKICFDGGNLKTFIENNGGKTIYIPAGKYDVSQRIYIRTDNTKLIGAGMWHTEIYFDAASNNSSTYSNRGIETNNNDIVIEGLYLNTINNQRYYQSNSSYQVGKALMGSFGSNSVLKNVWAEHFECGAWIANYGSNSLFSDHLLVQHCRFRNNYADGINLCRGTKNVVVEYCSFRNNGDDDMASWSSSYVCQNNTFRYCTAENNWRASSLGLFGGENAYAHNLVILDGMENGVRINGDFDAKEGAGNNKFENISIYRCGSIQGISGDNGDLWGNGQAAFQLAVSARFDLQAVSLKQIDIYDSRRDAIQISGTSVTKKFTDLRLENISIDGTGRHGIYFNSPRGNATYCNLIFNRINNNEMTTFGNSFSFTADCKETNSVLPFSFDFVRISSENRSLIVNSPEHSTIILYDTLGRKIYQTQSISNETIIPNLKNGFYLVKLNNYPQTLKTYVLD